MGAPKLISDSLFVEAEESVGDVVIQGEKRVDPDTLPLSAFSGFDDNTEVVHLSNETTDEVRKMYASSKPTQESTQTVKVEVKTQPKQETTETEEVESVYDEIKPFTFKKYSFDNYSERFRKAHKYEPNITEPGWQLVAFPSNCIFYPLDGIYVKPLTVPSLGLISGALESKDFTRLLDILNMHINIDIRDLTRRDFKFFIVWLSLMSYTQHERTLDWVSKYGNKNTTIVRESALEFEKIDMTVEDANEYRKKYGLVYPTVRELEYTMVNDLTQEDKWLLDYAQYYEGSNPDEKMNTLNQHTSSFEKDITDFKVKFEHGIEEYVYVIDQHFNRESYLEDLKKKLNYLRRHADYLEQKVMSISESEEYESTCEMIGVFEAELYNVEQNLNMVAEEEKILLPFRPIHLLPNVHLEDDSE